MSRVGDDLRDLRETVHKLAEIEQHFKCGTLLNSGGKSPVRLRRSCISNEEEEERNRRIRDAVVRWSRHRQEQDDFRARFGSSLDALIQQTVRSVVT